VNHSTALDHDSFQAAWLVLLHLELIDETDTEKAFLNEAMHGLINQHHIPTDFFEKVLVSIQDATLKAFETLHTLQDQHQISLNIYISADAKSRSHSNHNWGFFRVEKNGTAFKENNANLHEIHFYLYLNR